MSQMADTQIKPITQHEKISFAWQHQHQYSSAKLLHRTTHEQICRANQGVNTEIHDSLDQTHIHDLRKEKKSENVTSNTPEEAARVKEVSKWKFR